MEQESEGFMPPSRRAPQGFRARRRYFEADLSSRCRNLYQVRARHSACNEVATACLARSLQSTQHVHTDSAQDVCILTLQDCCHLSGSSPFMIGSSMHLMASLVSHRICVLDASSDEFPRGFARTLHKVSEAGQGEEQIVLKITGTSGSTW